jgi:peptide/nickel transport system ATP-binding protein
MYLGRIVEQGAAQDVLHQPRHPYTRSLLAAVPRVDGQRAGEGGAACGGEMPSPLNPPAGCHFHPRCPERRPECSTRYPDMQSLDVMDAQAGAGAVVHRVACHLLAQGS